MQAVAIVDVVMTASSVDFASASLAVPVPHWMRSATTIDSCRSDTPTSPASFHSPESCYSNATSAVTSTCSTPAPSSPATCGPSHSASLISALEAVANTSAAIQSPSPHVPPRSSSIDVDLHQDFAKPLPALPDDSTLGVPTRAASASRPSIDRNLLYSLPQASQSAPALPSPMCEHPPPLPPLPPTSDAIRSEKRYRALLELVTGEHAYLEDLRILRDVRPIMTQPLLSRSPLTSCVLQIFLPLLAPFASQDARLRIARNTDDLVALHERLIVAIDQVDDALHWQVGEGDVSHRSDERVLQAAEAVCRIFAQEVRGAWVDVNMVLMRRQAPRFAIYDEFCAQHPDATSLIAQCADSRTEYEAYERQCAAQLSARAIPGPKLRLLDYAIKPVQRICRYPLTLAYLLKCIDADTSAHRSVADALEAMKEAATEVDNARVARDAVRKTIVVARRMEMPPSAQPAFLSFLGQIELVGALQFLHLTPSLLLETPQPVLKVKYLGALLYPTHLVLVKVKKADCYEPRHWYPLRSISLERTTDADGLLSHSVRLACGDHRFELGCKTDMERELWIERLGRAKAGSVSAWLGRIAENPVELPFDETTVSSVPVDTIIAPPTTPAEPIVTAAPLASSSANMLVAGRSRLSQMLGRTSSAMRDTVDLRLADVFSDACLAARYRPASEGKAARSLTPLSRRKSFAVLDDRVRSSVDFLRATATSDRPAVAHSRRLSLSTLPIRSFSSAGPSSSGTQSEPASAIEAEGAAMVLGRRPTLATARPWSGSWRRRQRTDSARSTTESAPEVSVEGEPLADSTASLTSLPGGAIALAGPVVALVNRNGSTSSSSGSSAPPSPGLPTPTDLDAGPRWFNLNPLSRRSRSAVSLPPFASAEQEEQAVAAAEFLRSGSLQAVEKKRWRETWRPGPSPVPAPGGMRSRETSLSLLGLFKPTLSPTLPSPSPVALPPVTSPVFEEPEPIFSVDFTPPTIRPRRGSLSNSSTPLLPAASVADPNAFYFEAAPAARPPMGSRRKSIKVRRVPAYCPVKPYLTRGTGL
jgi:hypothetical protein